MQSASKEIFMATFRVGPSSTYQTIAAAMVDAGPADTILLEDGYSNETADVLFTGMTISGDADSLGISLNLSSGVTSVFLTGSAPINTFDSADGNSILGNDGDNRIKVTGGADAVNGGLGEDRLIVDYRLATGSVTGDSTSNFTEAGGGARMVTITDGTIEHFTVLTGSGADTITTGAGDDIVKTGNGASTVTVGQGANVVIGGDDADTITGLDGGNRIKTGDGSNTVTTGSGEDKIRTGDGADTIVSGAGDDIITLRGGADTVNAGAGFDRVIVDYSAMTTNVIGGVTSGDLAAGYTGQIASTAGDTIGFVEAEQFKITTGSGDDRITTGDASDTLSGGAGSDTLDGGGGNDRIVAGSGTDTIIGGAGMDTLVGGDGDDSLYGGSDADVLKGGHGEDRLVGGGSSDTLTGGADADQFVFNGDWAIDTITDFRNGMDRINLKGLRDENGGDPISVSQLLFEQAGTTVLIRLDLDEDGTADLIDLDEDGSNDNVRFDVENSFVADFSAGDFIF